MATSLQLPISVDSRETAPEGKPALLLVMYANPDYYPPTVNAVSILRRHFRVTVVSRNMGEPFRHWGETEIIRAGPYASVSVKKSLPPTAKALEYRRFCAAVNETAIDQTPAAIYAYDPYGFVAAMRARPSRQTPVVFHLHELPEVEGGSWRSLETWITRYAVRLTRSASLIVHAEANRARIWADAARDPRPPMIVPNCTSREFCSIAGDPRMLARLRFERRGLLCIGWMGESNGHLEVVRSLGESALATNLDLVGPYDPSFGSQLTRLAATLGISARVKLHGWVVHGELTRRFASDAVGLSLYKPVHRNWQFNSSATNKLFEYAAMGLPVVVPDRVSYREFLKDENWVAYADPEDPASIARATEYILADRDRYIAMSLAARKAHEEKYNYEIVFQPVLDRILEMTESTGARM